MRVELRYFEGCPNWLLLDARLLKALEVLGEHPPVTHELVETPDEAARLEFRGSPTLLVDGADPFADQAGSVGMSCRIYRTESGPQGAPSVEQLVTALTR